MQWDGEATLRASPGSVARARGWLRREVARVRSVSDAVADTLELIVSELITNAVRAGCVEVHLRLRFEPDCVVVGVSDDAPGRPVEQRPSPDSPTGRGLMIIAAVAHDWGFDEFENGKQVWARVRLT